MISSSHSVRQTHNLSPQLKCNLTSCTIVFVSCSQVTYPACCCCCFHSCNCSSHTPYAMADSLDVASGLLESATYTLRELAQSSAFATGERLIAARKSILKQELTTGNRTLQRAHNKLLSYSSFRCRFLSFNLVRTLHPSEVAIASNVLLTHKHR
jgi:hypothetical protein